MNEFFQEVARLMTGFPPILLTVIAPFCGSLVACIVAAIMGGSDKAQVTIGSLSEK